MSHTHRGLVPGQVEVTLDGAQERVGALRFEPALGGDGELARLARAEQSGSDVRLGRHHGAGRVAVLVDVHDFPFGPLGEAVVAAVGESGGEPGEKLLDRAPVPGPRLLQPLASDLDVQVLRSRQTQDGRQVDRCLGPRLVDAGLW